MKRILLSTALVALTFTPAVAQTTTEGGAAMGAGDNVFYQSTGMNEVLASDFIGRSVYVTQTEVVGGTRMGTGMGAGDPMADPMTDTTATDPAMGTTTDAPAADTAVVADPVADGDVVGGVQDGWEDVGSIDDVIMTREGELQAVLVDVGGFLGMGARTVAIDIDSLNIVNDAESDDYFVVLNTSREDLENAPEYDAGEMDEAAADGAVMDTTAPVTAADDAAMSTGTDATAPVVADGDSWMTPNEGYGVADRAGISVDELTSASLYDANNDNVANVSDVVVGADGQIEAVVADVGGFLGIGTRTVALDFNELEIHRDEGGMGSDLRVYVAMTREQLDALPEYAE